MKSRADKQRLYWAVMLILFGVVGMVERSTDLSAWAWVAVLTVAGFIAFAIYSTDRVDWGFLIPAYVMWAISLMVALIELDALHDEFIATYVLATIALPFLVTFLRDRKQWWALIPAYVLLTVGLMVGLIGAGVEEDNELLIPAYIMFAIAIPFIAVYALKRKQWWALIPGGIMAVIGLSFLVAEAMIEYALPAVLIVVGLWMLARLFIQKEPVS